TFSCILNGKTPSHCVKAPLRDHRHRGIYTGDRVIGKRRGYAHNTPRLLFQHLSDSELSDEEKSEKVGRGQGIEVFGSEIRERLRVEDSGVIYQNIDGSEWFDACFDGFAAGFLLAVAATDKNQLG